MMKKMLQVLLMAVLLLPAWNTNSVQSQSPIVEYVFPFPETRFNRPDTTIAVRLGGGVDPRSIGSQDITVTGAAGRRYPGEVSLSDDQRTVIFKPRQPFSLGEQVQVQVNAGGAQYSYSFAISDQDLRLPPDVSPFEDQLAQMAPAAEAAPQAVAAAASPYVTAPADLPEVILNVPAADVGEGLIFTAPFKRGNTDAYMMILDNQGELVYYQFVGASNAALDFKVMDNGLISYWFNGVHYLLDNTYSLVKTVVPNNAYTVDSHDLILLPNGNYMFIIYTMRVVDMSEVVSGGNENAQVIGALIQEVDASGSIVFEWNSFDHLDEIPYTDSNADLTAARVDYVHANALELDMDGNILMSNRHLDEITKINRQTGEIMWRLGGKGNDFTFSAGPGIDENEELNFYYQHDVRRRPNGNLSIFDNHNNPPPHETRALEYVLDEENMTAELVWAFHHDPDVYSTFMGNVQLLPNGNKLIGWGGIADPNVTEINADDEVQFELAFVAPYVNYRAYRLPWHGAPEWSPMLVVQPNGGDIDLYFSWNGATGVDHYQVYGGSLSDMNLIDEVQKTGFEDSLSLSGADSDYCYYQVVPVDAEGQPMKPSNYGLNAGCQIIHMPVIFR